MRERLPSPQSTLCVSSETGTLSRMRDTSLLWSPNFWQVKVCFASVVLAKKDQKKNLIKGNQKIEYTIYEDGQGGVTIVKRSI